MTYCVGVLLHAGLVCASDSRTNAGVDNVSSFKKMKVFERQGDRVLVIMSSGNLSMTQNVINQLELNGRKTDGSLSIWTAQSMVEVASHVGETLREVRRTLRAAECDQNVDEALATALRAANSNTPLGVLDGPGAWARARALTRRMRLQLFNVDHWKSLKRQVRVRGSVTEVSAAEADAYFASRPRDAQIGAWASAQSRPMESRFHFEKEIARYAAKFGVSKVPRCSFGTSDAWK